MTPNAPKKAAKKASKAAKAPKAAKKAKAARKAPAKAARPARKVPRNLPGKRAVRDENRRHWAEAEHQHQDPRFAMGKPDDRWAKPHVDPRLDQGAIKNRRVPRMENVSNWYRQAPHPKER